MQKLIILALAVLIGCPVDMALGMDVNGELKRAMAEKLASDPANNEARFYYNTGAKTLKFYDGTTWATVLDTNAVLATPVGTVVDFAGSTAPSGWLLLDGSAVSRATYSALFSLIGTTYGVGDGSTTFNLPDAQGRVIAGKDDMSGSSQNRLTAAGSNIDGDVLGASGGLETMMQHLHSIDHDHASVTSGAGTSHTHGAGTYVDAVTGTFASSTHTHNHNHRWFTSGAQTFNSGGAAISLSLAQAASGSGSNQFVRGDAAYNAYTENDATAPSATASVNGSNSIVGSSGAEAAHTHAVNLPNFTGSSGNTGTGTTHGTVQPTLVLNKIIKY